MTCQPEMTFVPRGDDDEDDEPAVAMRTSSHGSGKQDDKFNPPMEYKVCDLPDAGLEDKLNELGKDGWALVATSPQYIFRRMKKGDEEKPKQRVGFGI